MSDKLKAADVLAKAVREYFSEEIGDKGSLLRKLAAYEAAPVESQAAGGDWIERCAKAIRNNFNFGTCTEAQKEYELEVAAIIARHAPIDQSQLLVEAQARIAELEAKVRRANELAKAVHDWDFYELADSASIKAFNIHKIRARMLDALSDYEAEQPPSGD